MEEGCKAPSLTRACHRGCASTPLHHGLQGEPGEVPAQQDTAEQELGWGSPGKPGSRRCHAFGSTVLHRRVGEGFTY